MASQTIDAVYENGVLRPVEPLPLVDGVRVGLILTAPTGPLTDENVAAMMRLGQKCSDGLTEAQLEAFDAGADLTN
ncbi:MAG: antitoxin family protein [Planctomycetia bacterium]|nr:antitoxin family protein [Planctomycetia bacterium]